MQVSCPHCQNPIEIIEEAPLSDISCPSCDSRFSLVGDLLPGTIQHQPEEIEIGRFRLIQRLGRGAFGEVWRANDPQLDRAVAIKIPRKQQLNPQESEQFLREARTVAQLNHPSIVSIHEIGQDEGRVYIVSDLIDGVTLADRLGLGALSVREAANLCIKIAAALDHAHENGVIHRDLKPSNIMLDNEGEPHVMDFGMAKREGREITMTVEGQLLGTPAYMSPEQAKGSAHEADRRSDVYTLGVILFELLTGERPFRGNERMLVYQVLNDESPSPSKLNGNIPRDLETIVLKCLEKDPNRRYQTAHELATELERFLKGESILARPVGAVIRTWRWCKRNQRVALLLLAVFLSLSLGGGLSTWQWRAAVRAGNRADREHEERLANQRRQSVIEQTRLKAEKARLEAEFVQSQAAAIMVAIHGQGNYPDKAEFAALRKLADSSAEVRISFVEQLIDPNQDASVANARRLRLRYSYVVHAAVGLDSVMRDRIGELLVRHGSPLAKPVELNISCAQLGFKLRHDEPESCHVTVENYVAALEKTNDANIGLGPTFAKSWNPAEKQAGVLGKKILAAMKKTNDWRTMAAFGQVMGRLGTELLEEQANDAALEILRLTSKTKDYRELTTLVNGMAAFRHHVAQLSIDATAKQVAVAVEGATKVKELVALGDALNELGERTASKHVVGCIQRIVARMERSKNPRSLAKLGQTLGRLGAKLDTSQAATAARSLLMAIEAARNTSSLPNLCNALVGLGKYLPAKFAAECAKRIVAVMKKKTDPYALYPLGRVLAGLEKQLPADLALAGTRQAIAAIDKTTDAIALALLSGSIMTLAERLSSEQASVLAQEIVKSLEESTDRRRFPCLSSALSNLGKQLSVEQSNALAKQIGAAMEKRPAAPASGFLARGLGSVGSKLSKQQTVLTARQIVAIMNTTTDSAALSHFGFALGSLGENLPAEQAAVGAKKIVSVMLVSSDGQLEFLCRALFGLTAKLRAEHAGDIAEQIAVAMAKAKNPGALANLCSALGGLGERLTAERAAVAAGKIVSTMQATTNASMLNRLIAALDSVSGRLTVADSVSLLKSLPCVDDVQAKILRRIATVPRRQLDGRLWTTIKWAANAGIDVKQAARFPLDRKQ